MKNVYVMKLTKDQWVLYKTWLWTFLAIAGIHLIWSFLFLNQKVSESFGRLEVQIAGLGAVVGIVTTVLFMVNKEKNYLKGLILGGILMGLGFLLTSLVQNYNSPNLRDAMIMTRLIGYALIQGIVAGALITRLHRHYSSQG